MSEEQQPYDGPTAEDVTAALGDGPRFRRPVPFADEDFAEVEGAAEPVPMYAISGVVLEGIERALVALGIDDANVGPGVINTINPTATLAMGFIRAARENGPIKDAEHELGRFMHGGDKAFDALALEREAAQRQRDFLTVQIDSLIRRVGAALVAAGVMDANAMEGFILKETLPLQHALVQIGQQP